MLGLLTTGVRIVKKVGIGKGLVSMVYHKKKTIPIASYMGHIDLEGTLNKHYTKTVIVLTLIFLPLFKFQLPPLEYIVSGTVPYKSPPPPLGGLGSRQHQIV